MSKKNFILLVNMLLCVALSCACGKEGENQYIVLESEETMTDGDASEVPVEDHMPKINREWEDAYKEIVRNMDS